MFARDIGIDLGTASVLVYIKDKGIVLRAAGVGGGGQNPRR